MHNFYKQLDVLYQPGVVPTKFGSGSGSESVLVEISFI